MDELIAACFLFLHSYGIEPMDSVRKPTVSIVSAAELKRVVGGSALGACIDGHIYLDNRIDLKTTIGKSTLCHEIVHFTQNYCPRQKNLLEQEYKEKIAYQLQNQFLMDHGEKFRAVNAHNLEGSSEGYTRPPIINKGYGDAKIEGPPKVESADEIRSRFNKSESEHERREKRGFGARFEDGKLDESKIKEYNTHTR